MGSVCCSESQDYSRRPINSNSIVQEPVDENEQAALQAIQNGNMLKQTVLLSFKLQDIPNLDTFSKTDSFLVLFELKKVGQEIKKQKVGRTECVPDNLNPVFVKNIQVDYLFEEAQTFVIEAYDQDQKDEKLALKDQDFIGKFEFKLHEIVTSKDQTYTAQLQNPKRKNNGKITIACEQRQKQMNSQTVLMKFKGQLKNSGSVFFIIWKKLDQSNFKAIFRSEPQKKQNWKEFILDSELLCNCDENQEFKIQFYKFQSNGDHKTIGFVLARLQDFIKGQREILVNGQKIQILKFEQTKSVNFLEYVFGGCQINLSIAIDFTASNGQPQNFDSLHNRDPSKNEYLNSLRAIGDILQYYDSDKKIPAFGFGAFIQPLNRVSHCFALNGDIFKPECNGIQGVEQAYQNCLSKLQFSGPTNFADVISTVIGRCEAQEISNQNQCYQILLILTDGVITDLQQTIDQIVRGSNQPLSIVIVGVGQADFESMEQLDGDDAPLFSQAFKKSSERDIVQFVPYQQNKDDLMKLAKETLKEIPQQLVGFFQKKNIQPKPARESDRQAIQMKLKQMNNYSFDQQLDLHQQMLKQKLIDDCGRMGINPQAVTLFLQQKGLWENKIETLLSLINDPNFVNPLKPINYQPHEMMINAGPPFVQY